MFNKVVDIKKCHLQKEPSNKIRLSIKKFALENRLSFFDINEHKGLIRNLLIRSSSKKNIMVLVQFYENQKDNINLLMQHIKDNFPEITSLSINTLIKLISLSLLILSIKNYKILGAINTNNSFSLSDF